MNYQLNVPIFFVYAGAKFTDCIIGFGWPRVFSFSNKDYYYNKTENSMVKDFNKFYKIVSVPE